MQLQKMIVVCNILVQVVPINTYTGEQHCTGKQQVHVYTINNGYPRECEMITKKDKTKMEHCHADHPKDCVISPDPLNRLNLDIICYVTKGVEMYSN